MNDLMLAAIRREIHQAQQPLLERIDELEKSLSRAEDYIWKLNALTLVLMKTIPAEQAGQASQDLDEMLDELPDEQLWDQPAQDVRSQQQALKRLAASLKS